VYHKASLLTMQDFWRQLTRETVSLERLGDSFKRMEQMESMADKTYKLVLDRYPRNAKLLKSYGKFLEHVKVCAKRHRLEVTEQMCMCHRYHCSSGSSSEDGCLQQ